MTVRRHSSLPDPRRRSTLFRRNSKRTMRTNPYVGWFRHSPSVSGVIYSKRINILKDSPYVGWFRHAPTTSVLSSLYTEFSREFVTAVPPKRQADIFQISDLLSGHLKGGNRKDSSSSIHPTANFVLNKFSTWFWSPFSLDEFESAPKRVECEYAQSISSVNEDDASSSDSSENLDEESYQEPENDDSGGEAANPLSRQLDEGVSSQADAYFAHRYTSDLLMDDSTELDQVITQMDIARMTRNASRHLDVESIFKLPTMIYRCQPIMPRNPSIPEDREVASSWMIVEGNTESQMTSAAEHAPVEDPKEEDACVICLERYEEGDHLRVLPCNHSFHVGCIDRWLSGSHSFMECDTSGCPTCKARPDRQELGGDLPSWAFAQLGSTMSRSSIAE